MSARRAFVSALTLAVALVWIYHGLVNKLLHAEPRHLQIVQSVPGLAGEPGETALALIGCGELLLGLWVVSGRAAHACAAVQSAALLSMNLAEVTWARAHLVWAPGLIPVNLLFLAAAWLAVALRLRRHPLAIEAHFRRCLVLTYAMPAAKLEPLLPPGLELERHGDDGFVAVALVQADALRPAGLPRRFGTDFFLAGYRIFTRCRTAGGSRRGLKILRSDADKRRMVLAGNLLTRYGYQLCRAHVHERDRVLEITIDTPAHDADLCVVARLGGGDAPLPPGSPFCSAREARRFAGPLPWTFDYEPETHSIIAVEGVRTNWRPRLVAVPTHHVGFLGDARFGGAAPRLASAFYLDHVDYRWKRGVRQAVPA